MTVDRPRILLLADGLDIGGTERQVVELLKGLRRSGRFDAVLGVLDHGGALEAEASALAVEVLPLARRARFDCTPALALIGEARRARIRLIQTEGWMSSLASLPAARRLRLPLVNASLRGAPAVPSLRERLACWSARRSDAIVINGRAQLEAFDLAADRRTRVISNGLDLALFDHVVPAGVDGPAVCMVANFSRFKDHVTLIRALPRILERVPGATLTLVGHDAGTLDGVRRLAAELGVDGAVRFVLDTVRPEPLIAASAVGVLSTHGEGLSNAILEYMALAKPVVATDCAGNAEVVRDAETGYLVAPGSPESLAARIVELLSDRDRARAMGARGRLLVESRYTLDRMVADYERLYDELGAGR